MTILGCFWNLEWPPKMLCLLLNTINIGWLRGTPSYWSSTYLQSSTYSQVFTIIKNKYHWIIKTIKNKKPPYILNSLTILVVGYSPIINHHSPQNQHQPQADSARLHPPGQKAPCFQGAAPTSALGAAWPITVAGGYDWEIKRCNMIGDVFAANKIWYVNHSWYYYLLLFGDDPRWLTTFIPH